MLLIGCKMYLPSACLCSLVTCNNLHALGVKRIVLLHIPNNAFSSYVCVCVCLDFGQHLFCISEALSFFYVLLPYLLHLYSSSSSSFCMLSITSSSPLSGNSFDMLCQFLLSVFSLERHNRQAHPFLDGLFRFSKSKGSFFFHFSLCLSQIFYI